MGSSSKSYTPPKGKPTRARAERGGGAYRMPAIFEWIIVGVVLLALVVAAWYFSVGNDGGTTQHNGAPIERSAVAAAGVFDDDTTV